MDIIEEVKRRYPLGTRFFPAHIRREGDNKGKYCVIVHDRFKKNSNDIYSYGLDNEIYSYDSECGNNSFNRAIYYEGKWAEILNKSNKIYELW
jgi:hypothetical protein